MLSLISFISFFQLSAYKSFVFLGRFIPRYFILFVAKVNGIVSLISLSYLSLLVYRNARDFCIFNFVSCDFTKFIDQLSQFSGDIFRIFFVWYHVICKQWQFDCFSNSDPFYFSSIIAVVGTFNSMLNNSCESGHPYLVPDLRGNAFSFYHWEWCYLWVCHIWPLLCWGSFPLCPLFGGFCHKWVLNFVKSLFGIYWDDHMVVTLSWCCLSHWLISRCSKILCIPGITPAWSWCMIILIHCWIQFASIDILLRIFTSMFISDVALKFSFSVISLFGFGIRVMVAS